MSTDKREYLTLEEVQAEELQLLVDFTGFLDSVGLRYSLHAGTLLGAVRHGGFIPWDDDVDISMPRPDYEKLFTCLEGLPEDLFVADYRNSPLPLRFAKACTRKVRVRQPGDIIPFDQYLWIDIFPIDGMPDALGAQDSHFKRALLNKRMKLYLTLEKSATGSKTKSAAIGLYRMLPAREWRGRNLDTRYERLWRMYPYDSANIITTSLASDAAVMWSGRKEHLCDWGSIDFCGHAFSVYSNAEDLLMSWFGDYMQLPPESERISHDMKCWFVE